MASATESIVVDASVLLALLLPETPDRIAYATALVTRAHRGEVAMVLPQLAHIEIAAVVARKVRGNVITSDQAEAFFGDLADLAIESIIGAYSAEELYQHAMNLGCQVADAIYLRAAADNGFGLATLDGGMRQGAKALKLELFEP